MSRTPRWVRLARASLLVALGGHAIANAFLDEEQFTSVGLEYAWSASLPLLVQAIVVVAVVASLGPIARRTRPRTSSARMPATALWAAVAASQVAIFGILELSERLVQHEPFVDGLLSSGFSLELVFALAAATLLAAMANLAARVVRALGHLSERRRPTLVRPPSLPSVPRPRLAVVVGGERAPPA